MKQLSNVLTEIKQSYNSQFCSNSLTVIKNNHFLEKYQDMPTVMSIFNPDICSKLQDKLTKVYLSDTPTLYNVASIWNDSNASAWLQAQLIALCKFASLETTPDILKECAALIIKDHSDLKLTELCYFFGRVCLGYYGKFFGKTFDPIQVGEALIYYKRKERPSGIDLAERARYKQEKELEARRQQIEPPPEGMNNRQWYEVLCNRALNGDAEAIEKLTDPITGKCYANGMEIKK